MSDCTICHNGKTLSVGWKCDVCGRVNRSKLASSAGSALFAKWSPCIYMGAILCDDCVKGNMDDPDARCDMATGRRQHQRAFATGYAQGQNS